MGSTIALATRYEVSTQVASSWLMERLPAMCGSATLAMLVSSTSMKVASVTVMAMAHGLKRGRHSAFTAGTMESIARAHEMTQRTRTEGTTDMPGRRR